MSKIVVKEDQSGKEHFVEYWLSQKGNLAWKIGETVYVKLRSGYTSMLVDGEWKRSDYHTTARVPKATMPATEIQKTKLTTRLVL